MKKTICIITVIFFYALLGSHSLNAKDGWGDGGGGDDGPGRGPASERQFTRK